MAPAWGRAAACSEVMSAGSRARALCGTHTYSANPPIELRMSANTTSPGRNSVALRPGASTRPAMSEPSMWCRGRNGPPMREYSGLPRNTSQSEALTDTACTLTSTSLSLGTGVATSAIRSTPGGP